MLGKKWGKGGGLIVLGRQNWTQTSKKQDLGKERPVRQGARNFQDLQWQEHVCDRPRGRGEENEKTRDLRGQPLGYNALRRKKGTRVHPVSL